jgi:3-dehydroquinate synthase
MGDIRQEIRISLGERSYDVVVDWDSLDGLGAALHDVVSGTQVGLISDDSVWPLYGERVSASLREAGFEPVHVVLPAGEKNKNLGTIETILDALLAARFDRGSTIVALGGGVVGDMAGFAASILLRGVKFVQVPTTILAQVDASVGGKTGVDHASGKNLIGAFHQPSLVYVDASTLGTLPRREIVSGLGEVVKHAVIRDADMFADLERDIDALSDRQATSETWIRLIERNCRIKAAVVAEDERESGIRAILNYGHTAAHAIESLGHYDRYHHGEAVLYGMLIAGELARVRGMWTQDEAARQSALVRRLIETTSPEDYSVAEVWQKMLSDKKVVAGTVRFVLPTRIGDARIVGDVSFDEFASAWASMIS